jgi:hypothetical protein
MGAIKLYRGVSIYQVDGSQNWYVRIWNREKQRYIVKATGQTSAAKAREVALTGGHIRGLVCGHSAQHTR